MQLVFEHRAEVPEHAAPVNLLPDGVYLHLLQGAVTAGDERQALALILCVPYLFRVFLCDGQLLLLVGTIFLEVVPHGPCLRSVHLLCLVLLFLCGVVARLLQRIRLLVRQTVRTKPGKSGLLVLFPELGLLPVYLCNALFIVVVDFGQFLLRAVLHQGCLVVLVLTLQGEQVLVKVFTGLQAFLAETLFFFRASLGLTLRFLPVLLVGCALRGLFHCGLAFQDFIFIRLHGGLVALIVLVMALPALTPRLEVIDNFCVFFIPFDGLGVYRHAGLRPRMGISLGEGILVAVRLALCAVHVRYRIVVRLLAP